MIFVTSVPNLSPLLLERKGRKLVVSRFEILVYQMLMFSRVYLLEPLGSVVINLLCDCGDCLLL